MILIEESGKFDINSDSFLWFKLENNFAFIIISRVGDTRAIKSDKERVEKKLDKKRKKT